jgi:hypothetical protein
VKRSQKPKIPLFLGPSAHRYNIDGYALKMRFPKTVRHRNAEITIYGKTKNYPFYRICYRADGRRQMKNFAKYGEALKEAKEKAKSWLRPIRLSR